MRNRIVAPAVGVVLVVLAVVWLRSGGQTAAAEAGPPPGAGGPPALNVSVVVVEPQPLRDEIVATGTLLANEEVQLSSETSGRVVQVLFQEGAPVRPGQLLVKINDAELRAQRQATLQRLELAELAESRRSRLLEIGGVSQEELDQSRNQAGVLRAELQLLEAQLAKTEIRAPFAGVIGLRSVSPGSFLTPQSPVAMLRQMDPVRLDFDVPERYGSRVRTGDVVNFRVQGSATEYQATVFALEPGLTEATRTVRVRARASNGAGTLRPGGFAEVRFALQAIEGALLVPTPALVPSADRTLVYVVREGKAEPRPVRTGVRTADQVQIVSGVEPGDSVITSGIQLLRPGQAVRTGAS